MVIKIPCTDMYGEKNLRYSPILYESIEIIIKGRNVQVFTQILLSVIRKLLNILVMLSVKYMKVYLKNVNCIQRTVQRIMD